MEKEGTIDAEMTLEKAQALTKKLSDPAFPEDLERARQLEQDVKRLITEQKATDNPLIQRLLSIFQEELSEVNAALLNDETITPEQRNILFFRKKYCKKFLALFDIQSAIADKDKEITNELSHLNNTYPNAG